MTLPAREFVIGKLRIKECSASNSLVPIAIGICFFFFSREKEKKISETKKLSQLPQAQTGNINHCYDSEEIAKQHTGSNNKWRSNFCELQQKESSYND